MRGLLLNYEYPPIGGGGANATRELLIEFSNSEFDLEIDLVTSSFGADYEVERFSRTITIHKIPVGKKALHYWTKKEILLYLFRSEKIIRKLMTTKDYDLSHAIFGFPSGFISWRIKKLLPYVVSLRGSDVPGFNPRFKYIYPILRPLFRGIWSSASSVVANSEGLKTLAESTWSKGNIKVIPNGVDDQEFKPSNVVKPKGHLLCVSRLVERKGLRSLIVAMKYILKKDCSVHLTIIGSGNQDEELRALAIKLEVDQNVTFLGIVDHSQLPIHYQRASLYIQPSYYEGMSNTILEAMSSALPILTSAEGGVEELIRDNALRFPFNDSRAISEAVLSLLSDSEKLASMGESSRKIAEQFSWSAVAEKYYNIYKDISNVGVR